MNASLARLIEGIIATLRTDVIPNVQDSYARGQAVGVIDLLNNIGPRVEWARQPILESVNEKRALLCSVATLLGVEDAGATAPAAEMTTAELIAERDRLDAAIGDELAHAHARGGEVGQKALGLLIAHLHDEQTREMKLTRKPLFAEIASGRNEKAGRKAE